MSCPGRMPRSTQAWKWLTHDPGTDYGVRELAEFIADDLRNAVLVHSPHGAEPFVPGGDRRYDERPSRFSSASKPPGSAVPTRKRGAFGELGPVVDTCCTSGSSPAATRAPEGGLLGRAEPREVPAARTRCPGVRYDIAAGAPRRATCVPERPSWQSLIQPQPRRDVVPNAASSSRHSTGCWISDRRAGHAGRTRSSGKARDTPFVRLRLDEDRDTWRTNATPMMAMYVASRRRRPSFVDFFENEDPRTASGDPGAFQDSTAITTASRGFRLDVTDEPAASSGDDDIEGPRQRGDKEIPAATAGPAGRRRRQPRLPLRRQVDARMDALRKTGLVDQLADPFTIRGMTDRWRDAGDGLGKSTHIVHTAGVPAVLRVAGATRHRQDRGRSARDRRLPAPRTRFPGAGVRAVQLRAGQPR